MVKAACVKLLFFFRLSIVQSKSHSVIPRPPRAIALNTLSVERLNIYHRPKQTKNMYCTDVFLLPQRVINEPVMSEVTTGELHFHVSLFGCSKMKSLQMTAKITSLRAPCHWSEWEVRNLSGHVVEVLCNSLVASQLYFNT